MIWIPVILILPYIILLSKKYRRLVSLKTFTSQTSPVTSVSVIAACRNEEKNLPRLLACLANQNYPENLFEIVIVDDHSDDHTFKVASGFKQKQLVTLNNRGKGKKAALRTGIVHATGDLIITTDADCIMGKDWIATVASFFERDKPDMIISPVKLELVRTIFGKFQELEYMSLQGITAAFALSGNPVMCNGANLAFRKETYMEHSSNLHDEIDSGDDIFFLHSLKKIKGSAKWLESQKAMVTTAQSPTFASFLRQRSRWISKGKYYSDRDTIVTAVITFVAVLLQGTFFIASFLNTAFLPVFLTIFILKSIPDYLITRNTATRYGNKNLMRWFLPAQIIYPFYVILVVICKKRRSPMQL